MTNTNVFTFTAAQADKVIGPMLEWLNALDRLPSIALVTLSCLILGFLLKKSSWFPNQGIPFAIIVWAMFFSFFLAPARPEGETLTGWKIINMIKGFIAGGGAWLLHAKVFKWLTSKFPFLGNWLPEEGDEEDEGGAKQDKPVDSPKPPSV